MRDLILRAWRDDLHTALDLGCGDLWFTENLPGITKLVGVDAFMDYLEKAQTKNLRHEFVPILDTIEHFIMTLRENEYDVTFLIDVVEHMSEEYVKNVLLDQIERTTKKLIIIWTTMGYIEQGEYDNNGTYNPLQKHLWGPVKEDFINKGYEVVEYPTWHGDRGGGLFVWKNLDR
jgi:hypothetical protein